MEREPKPKPSTGAQGSDAVCSARDRLLAERIKEYDWWQSVVVASAILSLVLTGIWLLLEGKLLKGLPGFGPLPFRSFFLGLFDRVFVGALVILVIGCFGAIAKGLYKERNRHMAPRP